MNFKITHNWLLDYIDTDATPEDIQNYLSLSSVNVETLEKIGDDTVYDIEVTTNRIDCASVLGIAIECVATLPLYGKKAVFKNNPLSTPAEVKEGTGLSIDIHVDDDDVVSRVAGMAIRDVTVGPSSELIRSRLEACGEHSINNVVDISNYLRIAYGQPVHMFDYDAIVNAHMSIELSKPDDIVTLIDGTELKLPGGDIIIRDGDHRIIDLVGLMGGQNTEITSSTKNVLLFVPVVNKTRIRKTSMTTGRRTAAISYFEKGLDEERVLPTLAYGIDLLVEHAHGTPASQMFDYYPHPAEPVYIDIQADYMNARIGTQLSIDEMVTYIEPLGFKAEAGDTADSRKIRVPSYRAKDVTTQADIVEEVARMYGYHTIVPQIQQTDVVYQPLEMDQLLSTQEKVRDFLSAIGFFEQYNYSMVSQSMIENMGQDISECIRLSNTLSTDIEYLRTSLLPSLLKNIADNQDRTAQLHFFECARVYLRQDGDLPRETPRLALASTIPYDIMMGVYENMLKLLHIDALHLKEVPSDAWIQSGAHIVGPSDSGDVIIGTIGLLHEATRHQWGIKQHVTFIELDLDTLVTYINSFPAYVKPNPYAHITQDYTYVMHEGALFADMKAEAYSASTLLVSLDVISRFEDKVTIRCTFASRDRNITEAEVKDDFEKIKEIFKHD